MNAEICNAVIVQASSLTLMQIVRGKSKWNLKNKRIYFERQMSLSTPSTALLRNTRLSLKQRVIIPPPTVAGNDGATLAVMGIKFLCEGRGRCAE
jgi:hypothetical protein